MKAFLAGAFALLALTVAPSVATAATIPVNTVADEYGTGATCSLREAITAAQTNAPFGGCSGGIGDDRITLPGGEYKITRAGSGEDGNVTGDFDITGTGDLWIQTSSPTDQVTINGNGLDRVFDMSGMGVFTLSSIRVTGGKLTEIEDGGGIRASSGTTRVEDATIDDNESAYQGGGVAVYNVFNGVNSTISGNRAGGNGGGFYAPGGSTLILRNTTIVMNKADADGNDSGYGGGFSEAGADSVSFRNVLNAGNTSATPPLPDLANDCYSGANFFPRFTLQTQPIGPSYCLSGSPPNVGNVSVADAMFGPLGYHGGQTPTHNLLKGSPAIGAGGTASPDDCLPIDQNGVGRIAGSCDIGSTTYVPKSDLAIVQILPKKKVIRRKKARQITIVVTNRGDATAEGVRVCLVLPKAARKGLKVKGQACRTPGDILAGATKRPKVRLTAKPRAKKRAYPVRISVAGRGTQIPVRVIKVRVR